MGSLNLGALEDDLVQEQQRSKVVGFSIAIVKDDEVLLERGFGLRDKAKLLPVTEHTLFAIGSSSKAFTATLLAALVDDGKLEWDRPVRDYLPYFKLSDPHATELMTAVDLLCHNSGLPTHDFVWYGNHTSTRREIVERLRHLEPNAQFRQVWQYNNLMYLTAGHLAGELLGGITWEEAVRRRLLEPLGMSRTGFSVAEMAASNDWSQAYRDDAGTPKELPLRDLGLAGPAGSINSSAHDMAAWLRVNLNSGKFGDKQVIAADALTAVQSPHMHMPAMDEMFAEKYFIGYGLGWFLESYRGERLVYHPGLIDGFAAMVMLIPRIKAGVVVLTNGNHTNLHNVAAYRVIDELLGLEPLPWGERYQGLVPASNTVDADSRVDGPTAPPSRPLDAFAGRYRHPGYGDITFEVADGKLGARFNSHEIAAERRHDDAFDLRLAEALGLTITANFLGGASGEVAAVSIPFPGAVKAVVFDRVP